ncbi:M23 family metallopeptidase [Sphingomonas sp.]|uniref:M23 family metallopeptidase n=1 Tax=Sphingomonas sp. TaxID=28214 RepID=UPI002ED84B0B
MKPLVLASAFMLLPAASAQYVSSGLLDFPLKHKDVAKMKPYSDRAYTPASINTVLDHNMGVNSSNNYYDYGTYAKGTANGIIQAFNGESVSAFDPKEPKKLLSNGIKDGNCIRGWITLKLDNSSKGMTRAIAECGGYTSYDDHPGYDYEGADGVPVYAADTGTVLNIEYNGKKKQRCIILNMPDYCDDWGAVGIQHKSGYITQYLHMRNIQVAAGQVISQPGTLIGYVSGKAPSKSLGPHLHFEVLIKSGSKYYFVDPYGWTGGKGIKDELTARSGVGAKRLWSGK